MQAAPLTPELRAAAPAVAARVAAIFVALATLIARAFLHDPRRVAIIVPLWGRLNRAARRLSRLMARLAAGTEPRPSRPRARSGTSSGAPPIMLPSAHGWLVADLRHEAAVYALRLERLLAEPEAAAIVAACPAAARILRPLCRMLGVRPAALPARQRARRRPPPPAPAVAGQLGREAAAMRPPAFQDPTAFRPLHETAPCAHVGWPWFPHKSPGVA